LLRFSVEESFDGFDPSFKLFFELLNSLALTEISVSVDFFWSDFEMFFSGFHKFKCLGDFLFEFFGEVEKLFSGVVVGVSPVLAFFRVEEWIVDVLHHVVEDTHGVWCELSEKNLFVAPFVDVYLNRLRVTFFLF
jgi:hypothetical protein